MKTLGEQRIRTTFNPSGLDDVERVKQKCALIIDSMQDMIGPDTPGEVRRLIALGHTSIEYAAMNYVKALTHEEE